MDVLAACLRRNIQLAANPQSNPERPVPAERRDTGTSRLGHASRPSMARSGADVLSAHGPKREVPISRLGFVDSFRTPTQLSLDTHLNFPDLRIRRAELDQQALS